MKKTISILLLHVMMLIAIHPVVAMHYCGGELYSYNLFNTDGNQSCCVEPLTETLSDHDSACCDTSEKLPTPFTYDSATKIVQDSCCDFEKVEISTDDFQYQANQKNLLPLLSIIKNNWFNINDLFALNQPKTNTKDSENEFPTKGLFMDDVSILTYICIYRI